MSTRSRIIVHCGAEWRSIYCHHDGYPGHVGRILQGHYASQERAEALIALGDLSCLYESIEAPKGHSYDTPVPRHTIAYHRDRGESWEATQPRIGATLLSVYPTPDSWIDYVYIWTDGAWSVRERSAPESTPLVDVLASLSANRKEPA